MSRTRHAFTLVELPVVSMRKCAAFTLVELLVVVTVIAIVIAMLLPALRSARETARMAVCASNFHQVGIAANAYAAANRMSLPPYGMYVAIAPSPLSLPDPARGPGVTYQPTGFRRQFVMTEWFRSGSFTLHPRGGDGYFGPYLNTGFDIDPTALPGADGTYGGMRSILSCPSEPIGPTPKVLTWLSGTGTFWTYRAFSYGVNWGDHTGGWPFYAGVFETVGFTGMWPVPGARISDLPATLVVMADGPGTSPYLHGPYPEFDPFPTYHKPPLRHVNSFNAVFVDGHSRNGSYDTLYTIEYWLRDYP